MAKVFIRRTASQQLAEQIRRQIDQGTWAVGDAMPSMRKLAAKYRVSLATVQKAMQELDNCDIIKLLPRQGGIVQTVPAAAATPKNQIGVVIGLDPSVHLPLWWTHQIIHFAQLAMAESGYVLTLFNYLVAKPDHTRQVIDQMSGMMDSLAGVFYFPTAETRDLVKFLDKSDVPWMTINPITLNTHHNFVMADQLAAGRLVGRCFARLGYERVALVYDEVQNVSPLEKITGLYQGYLLEGKSTQGIETVLCQNMETQEGYNAMRRHLESHRPPQGIFSTADTLAVGAMRACQELGLRVPDDLGVVGSTGLPDSQLHSDPPLTELRQPVEAIGRQLALCLLEMIRGGVRQITGRRVPAPLILRSSLRVPEAICRELGIQMPEEAQFSPSDAVEPAAAIELSQSELLTHSPVLNSR